MELAHRRGMLAIVAGSPSRPRGPPAMGTPPTGWIDYTRPGPPPLHRNIGPGEHSGSRTSQARKITRTSYWLPSKAFTPLRRRPACSTTSGIIHAISHNFLSKVQLVITSGPTGEQRITEAVRAVSGGAEIQFPVLVTTKGWFESNPGAVWERIWLHPIQARRRAWPVD